MENFPHRLLASMGRRRDVPARRRATAGQPGTALRRAGVSLLRRQGRPGRHQGRGYCIPSGRIEPGEALDAAAEREVWEETGGRLAPDRRRLIGCYRLVSRAGPSPESVRWCPVFVAEALGFEPIPAGSEFQGLFLAAIEDVADLYFTWDPLMAAVFAYADAEKKALLPIGPRLSELF